MPGELLRGKNWNYRLCDAVKGDGTHTSATFKAEVIPHDHDSSTPQWAFIKAASPGNAIAMENLGRECQTYLLPGLASSTCFRQIYDVIGNGNDGNGICVALEWLDTTLAEVKYQPNRPTYALIGSVLSAALDCCAILDRLGYVNTDYKPANILLSNAGVDSVIGKVGDLGLVFPVDQRIEAQPYSMRAPEVFLGKPCGKASQVWAVAAMLLCWIKPGILGAWGSPHYLLNEAWSMAKLKRLFPGWAMPAPSEINSEVLAVAVRSATRMSRDELDLQPLRPFEQEVQHIEMPEQLRALLGLMLVPEAVRRPSASAVLASREFEEFKQFVHIHRE